VSLTRADLAAALYTAEELVVAARRNLALPERYDGALESTIDCAERAREILTRVARIVRDSRNACGQES